MHHGRAYEFIIAVTDQPGQRDDVIGFVVGIQNKRIKLIFLSGTFHQGDRHQLVRYQG